MLNQMNIQIFIIGFKMITYHHIIIIYTKNHNNNLNKLKLIRSCANSHDQAQTLIQNFKCPQL